MTEKQLKEKDRLEKQLDKLVEQETKLREKLHTLSFPESIEHVERQFKSDYVNEYTIIIEKGNKFDIKTRANPNLLKHEVVFVLPNEYSTKLMDLLKLAADNEISK
jgi:hypothetical protein